MIEELFLDPPADEPGAGDESETKEKEEETGGDTEDSEEGIEDDVEGEEV